MATAAPKRTFLGRIALRKSVAQIQEETRTSELKRSLGPWNLVFLGIGCIIGAGIFVRTGNAAALHAGPAVLISYAIAGLICAFAGLCYAELASTLPVSGSAYTYSYATIGEFAAWVMGALLVLEYGLAASVVAVGWSGYVVSLLGDFGLLIPSALTGPTGHHLQKDGVDVLVNGAPVVYLFNLPAFLVSSALAILLVIGVSESAKFNNVIVAIKVTVLTAFILVGGAIILTNLATYAPNWDPFIPPPTGEKGEFGWSGILRAASIVFFAYIGFDAVSTAAQEAKNPQRDMPIGIIGSLIICTVLYIVVAAIATGVVPYGQLDVPDPIAKVADYAGLGIFASLIKLGAIAGLTSVILVQLLGQSRVFYSMSRDGLLPPFVQKIHPRFRTPYITSILTGLAVAIPAGLLPVRDAAKLVSIGTLLAFVIVSIGVLVLRVREPDLPRPFKTPFIWFVAPMGAISAAYLMFYLDGQTWIRLLVWLLIGFAIYFLYGRTHSKVA